MDKNHHHSASPPPLPGQVAAELHGQRWALPPMPVRMPAALPPVLRGTQAGVVLWARLCRDLDAHLACCVHVLRPVGWVVYLLDLSVVVLYLTARLVLQGVPDDWWTLSRTRVAWTGTVLGSLGTGTVLGRPMANIPIPKTTKTTMQCKIKHGGGGGQKVT